MNQLTVKLKEYLADERIVIVNDALHFATKAHTGQTRLSGGPYIDHPITAATYLADLHLDEKTIAAALLHDVVEDCDIPLSDIKKEFGEEVAKLVDGVTKLKLIKTKLSGNSESDTERSDNLRKMLVAMAEDIRVVLIKLADRLHNMQTLEPLPPNRQIEIAQETLDIYAPLAHRLGIWDIKWQLEDLSFRYLKPLEYRQISKMISIKRVQREEVVGELRQVLLDELGRMKVEAEVIGRVKHIYSIYQKGKKKNSCFRR